MAGNPLPIEDILRNHNGHFVVVLTPTDVVDAPITVTVPTKRKVDDDGPITLSTKRLCEILDESQAIKQRREGSESRLINIIPELKSSIISFLESSPKSLVNLALTCQDLREPATRVLYKTITVPINTTLDMKHYQMLGPANPGVKHIRHVILDIPVQIDRLLRYRECIKTVIELLPLHLIQSFRSSRIGPQRHSGFLRLCNTQKNLRNLEVLGYHNATEQAQWQSSKASISLPRVEELRIHSDVAHAVTACHVAQHFLQTCPRITKLDLKPWNSNHDQVHETHHDSEQAPGTVTKTLFKHLLTANPSDTTLALTHLTLGEVRIGYWDQSFLKAINFQGLQHLALNNCRGNSKALTKLRLYAEASSLQLKSFEYKPLKQNDDYQALNDFLFCFEGLTSLIIAVRHSNEYPNPQAIANHGATLTTLVVEGGDDEGDLNGDGSAFFDTDGMTSLVKGCPKLKQLATVFPEVQHDTIDDDFKAHLELCAANLPELHTLMFTCHPGFDYDAEEETPPPDWSYDDVASKMATSVFATVKQLKVVWFGRGINIDPENARNPSRNRLYVRGETKDILGNVSPTACVATKDQVQLAVGDLGVLGRMT